jgi:hypothetical protein
MPVPRLPILVMMLATLTPCRAQWVNLFNGKNLDGWEVIGDGVWFVMKDGILVGDRMPRKSAEQSWLYTKRDFGEFDLSLEYWTRLGGNSGISIRDQTRARYAVPPDYDRTRTPSHNGYEIQISNGYRDAYPSGSIYLFDKARVEAQLPGWNHMVIESRDEVIRVRLNGQLVSEHEGDPKRPKTGPIGLQLHDPGSVVMFRNIRIRELRKK